MTENEMIDTVVYLLCCRIVGSSMLTDCRVVCKIAEEETKRRKKLINIPEANKATVKTNRQQMNDSSPSLTHLLRPAVDKNDNQQQQRTCRKELEPQFHT
jgi:hypothetical protein